MSSTITVFPKGKGRALGGVMIDAALAREMGIEDGAEVDKRKLSRLMTAQLCRFSTDAASIMQRVADRRVSQRTTRVRKTPNWRHCEVK